MADPNNLMLFRTKVSLGHNATIRPHHLYATEYHPMQDNVILCNNPIYPSKIKHNKLDINSEKRFFDIVPHFSKQ